MITMGKKNGKGNKPTQGDNLKPDHGKDRPITEEDIKKALTEKEYKLWVRSQHWPRLFRILFLSKSLKRKLKKLGKL